MAWSYANRTLKVNSLTAAIWRRAFDLRNRDIRFVFVASTGRSGTRLIAEAFAVAADCFSTHEPKPIMHGNLLLARTDGRPELARRAYWLRKSIYIRRSALGRRFYVEANHLFAKSFYDFALRDFGDRARVLHLRRDPLGVAKSMAEVYTHVPGTEPGNRWYLDYRSQANRLKLAPELEDQARFGHDFFRCLWYWYEMEVRIREVRQLAQATGAGWAFLGWQDQLEVTAVQDVIEGFGMRCDRETLRHVLRQRVNTKAEEKRPLGLTDQELRDMTMEFDAYIRGRFPEHFGPEPLSFSEQPVATTACP